MSKMQVFYTKLFFRITLFNLNELRVHQTPAKKPEISSGTNNDVSKVVIDGVSFNKAFYLCDKDELFTDAPFWIRELSQEVEGKVSFILWLITF